MLKKPRWMIQRGFFHRARTPVQRGIRMNIIERRQLIRGRVIDLSVAKAEINRSKRERAEAARLLRKALVANRAASVPPETVSYPRR
jgi:hypothetical protein